MKKTEAFIANDGTVFMTEAEAEAYESEAAFNHLLDTYREYLVSTGMSPAAATRRKNLVVRFLVWKEKSY